ncbi:helix-turn-helix transcriptional regulator [Streptomyces sp. NBC_00076]|uniref:helix-turn-helix domain-containing protein n=1 Tax=Streptomyces sp. NBC_00076 TaxID=2975642 RepID=UPI00324F7DA7
MNLAEAAEIFRRLDAAPLLARTRAEQQPTGQHPRRDSAPARDTAAILTPQELRVARLAAHGLTNQKLGSQLLVSPRTVGHHLANVFPKLGIVSRTELARIGFGDVLHLIGPEVAPLLIVRTQYRRPRDGALESSSFASLGSCAEPHARADETSAEEAGIS